MTAETYLVTGAYGCIGAWVVRELVRTGRPVVAYDIGTDPYRLRLVMDPEELARVSHVHGDITDLAAIEAALDEHSITRIIHLAALQVPFCQADPPRGASVNVEGSANVFEAARRRQLASPLVYASSIAVYGESDGRPANAPEDTGPPDTIYGVYKRANEHSARIYWREWRVPSVGLRPHTVYGPGRDQGVTSGPTAAMLAASAGRAYRIPFSGTVRLQYAPDVARAFVCASELGCDGAAVHNLVGSLVEVNEIVAAIRRVATVLGDGIDCHGEPLPFPAEVDTDSFERQFPRWRERSIDDGIGESIRRFRDLLADGRIHAEGLPGEPM